MKYNLLRVWDALPRDPADPLWKGWEHRVHKAVVRADLDERVAALRLKPHLAMFMSLKPASHPASPSYLVKHGLGQWVKLRLRSSSLQLLSMLGRYIRPPIPDDQLLCRLCLRTRPTFSAPALVHELPASPL